MFRNKKALLLDMNSTFMFGEDRFGPEENYFEYYSSLNGSLSSAILNALVSDIYNYLDCRYLDEKYRCEFPSLLDALNAVCNNKLTNEERNKVINTFAYHELGIISEEYVDALYRLSHRFILALVIDIWSPKDMWLETFDRLNIQNLFSEISFSSDIGIVKPSPIPFKLVVEKLSLNAEDCLVVGDSIRRDLGGAIAAGIDCVLVGEASNLRSIASYVDLLSFTRSIEER